MLGYEVFDLLLTLHDEGEGGGLHTAYGEHLAVLSVLEGVETGGVHAEHPVADGAAQACLVEGLLVGCVHELGEAFAYGLVGER